MNKLIIFTLSFLYATTLYAAGQSNSSTNTAPNEVTTLLDPGGSTTDTTPTYSWNAVANSTWYYLWVNSSTGNVIKKWYTASDAGCANGTGICSVTPSDTLTFGAYNWWVKTWNDTAHGPWSAAKVFELGTGLPPPSATLISPLNNITDTTPTYSWNAVLGSSWYYLWVDDSSGNIIKKWYTAASAGCSSGSGTCSVTPTTVLAQGSGRWWIQTWSLSGYGPWSAANDYNLSTQSSEAAARFLTQTTFGPTQDSIDSFEFGQYENWLNDQFALPIESHLTKLRTLDTKMCGGMDPDYDETNNRPARHHIWWDAALNSPDQLRQRIAFALSQIFVVSETGGLSQFQFGLADYYDVLLNNSFGNFRDLLKEVTLHPMMGEWLSHLKNHREDPTQNIHPDENFAREILQLFSVGLYKLNQDGSLQLDFANKPIPTYGQEEVKQFARVFTGWFYDDIDSWWQRGATTKPMVSSVPTDNAAADFHETGMKVLLNGELITAGQTPEQDIDDAIDNIFNHENVAPFISKQLIQRLVTSNPSPVYISDVAAAFINNGNNVRGDMKTVIRAILLHSEARGVPLDPQSFGKLREPLLRFSHLWRAFGIVTRQLEGPLWPPEDTCGRGNYDFLKVWWGLSNFRGVTGQGPLDAPSVFNFYSPFFSPQGPIGDAGKVAPEFQIATENKSVQTANALNWTIQRSEQSNDNNSPSVLDLDDEINWANDHEQMMDKLNLLLLNGEMSSQLRSIILTHLNDAPFPAGSAGLRPKLEDAIMLIVNSHEYMVQK